MALFSHLRKASFGGVGFEVESGSLTFGRRVVTHEYPMRDTPYTEDLGRSARLYSITGFVLGMDWISRAKRLIAKLESSADEPQKLIHPWLGTLSVCVSDKPKVTWDTARRIARFEMSFVEAGELSSPSIATSWGNALLSAADSLMDKALDALGVSWEAIEDVTNIAENIADGSFQNILGCLSDSKFAQLMNLGETLSSIAGDAVELLSKSPSEFGATLIDAIGLGSISDTARSWKDVALTASMALTDSDSSQALYQNTEKARAASASGDRVPSDVAAGAALETFVRSVMVSNIAGAAAQIGGDTDESDGSMVGAQVADLEELRADMLDAVETEMLAQGTDDGDMYETLEGIYSGIYSHMTNDVMGNNKSVTLTPVETTPAVVLAYEQYGDAARGDEIASRNAVHNPLFVPPRALSILES